MLTRTVRSSSVVANRWFISASRSTFDFATQHEPRRVLVVGLVAQVLHHRQLLRRHLRRDLLEHLRAGGLERQLVDHDLAVLDLVARAQAQRAGARLVDLHEIGAARDELAARREIGALDVLHELAERRVRIVEQPDQAPPRLLSDCAAARPSTCRRRCRSCRSRADSAAAPAAAWAR